MVPALALANAPLDLQITICMFLHPADILALRKTCKALELVTRRRIIWIAVFRRVCLDNALFLPSFPIPDMSDLELEQAAMAPRRWIEFCSASQMRHSNDFSTAKMPHPRSTRIIKDEISYSNFLFIVPGGRYLVTTGLRGLFVWDLGYVSTAIVDCKLVASVRQDNPFVYTAVQVTSDGKGLVILTSYSYNQLSIFEIYPESELPVLTQIAHLDLISFPEDLPHLLPNTLILSVRYDDRIVFRVIDYRRNYSTCFLTDVDVERNGGFVRTFATKTIIIIFCKEEILIWAIPPLTPQPSDLPEDNNPTHIPPLFKIPFPDGIIRPHKMFQWMLPSSWYFDCWESIYLGILFSDSKLQRFKIAIKPDLSDASLHFINKSEIVSSDLKGSGILHERYMICDNALVYFWNNEKSNWGAYAGLTSPPTNVVTRWNGCVNSLSPTSGRIVYIDENRSGTIVVVDLF